MLISNQSHQSFQRRSVIGHCVFVIQFPQLCSCLATLSPSDKPLSKTGCLKERVDHKRWKCSKETKSDHDRSKIGIQGKWSCGRSSWPWECGHCCHSEDSRCAAEGLQWRELTNIMRKAVVMQRVISQGKRPRQITYCTFKELLEIFPNTESQKNTMLEADPDLERNVTIGWGIEKVFTPYHKLYDKKKATPAQTTLRFFSLLKKVTSQCSEVLNYTVLSKY